MKGSDHFGAICQAKSAHEDIAIERQIAATDGRSFIVCSFIVDRQE